MLVNIPMDILMDLIFAWGCKNSKILRCNLSSIMKNDANNYWSKHFHICFGKYLDLENKYHLKEEENKHIIEINNQLKSNQPNNTEHYYLKRIQLPLVYG